MNALSTFAFFFSASIRSKMAYKRSFLLEIAGRAVLITLEMLTIFFLFMHVPAIGGWTKWEVLYLFGAGNAALGLAELATSGMHHMSDLVRRGEFDRMLVRPAPVLAQMTAFQAEFHNLGRLLQGVVIVVCAFTIGGLSASLWQIAGLAFSVLGGGLVFASLFIASATACIWTIERSEAFNAFTYGGVQMVQYPLGVYPRWIGLLFVFAVPVGATLFAPASAAFGKPDPFGFDDAIAWLSPLFALGAFGATLLFWRHGLARYQSSGS